MKRDALGVQEFTCPVCGKVFAISCTELWVYKRTMYTTKETNYYCSYNCTLKADREREEIPVRKTGIKAQQRAKAMERGKRIDAMRSAGCTWQSIGDKLGISKQNAMRIHEGYLNKKSQEETKSD